MARELAFTLFLTGDPIALGAEVSSLPALARELRLPSLEGAGVLGVAPRVALIHSLTGAAEGLAVRIVRLLAPARALRAEPARARPAPPARRPPGRRADLIVMGTHGRTGVARFFLGSVAARVLALARCPVLTVR